MAMLRIRLVGGGLAALLVAASVTPASATATAGASPVGARAGNVTVGWPRWRTAQRADAALARALRRLVAMPGGPPGAVAIVQRGPHARLFRAGVADLRTGRRIRANDYMRLASTSKAFSGAAALRLVAQGRLSLDDTIGGRLTGFPRRWARVTLREALQHRSGLPDFSSSPKFLAALQRSPHARPSMRRLVSFVERTPLVFAPGTRYAYSNTDNLIVAFMVEAATGRSYRRELAELVYRPLGLHRTSLPTGFRLPSPYLHGYTYPSPAREDVSRAVSMSWLSASGGMVSTPAELNRFIRGYVGRRLFGRGVQAQQLRLVPGESEPAGPGQNRAGLGIFRYRTSCGTVYGHTGNFLGYTQFAAATLDGRRSVTVSVSEQMNQHSTGGLLRVFHRLRAAEATAACAALAGRGGRHAAPRVPRLSWRGCGGGFQCTTARVPLDYDRPRGRLISLALLRLPATDRGRRIGSLFVNPGGPGGSGVAEVRTGGRELFSPAIRARFDIVGMDPRGVGGSAPVRCFSSFDESLRLNTLLRTAPDGRAGYRERFAAARRFAHQCAARNGDLLHHLSTANVARDLDLLRQAVGDRGLTYDGISYGTYLGATYAAMFPRHVRALVLDGNVDPRAYRSGSRTPWLREHGHVAGWATLRQFFRLCAAAGPSRCALAAGGDPARTFRQLVARVRRSPITLPDGRRFDYGTLLTSTFSGLYVARQWSTTAQTLQDLYQARLDATPQRRLPTASATAPVYDNVGDAQLAITCSETRNPHQPGRYPRIAARADRTAPYAGSWITWLTSGCTFWRARDADRYTGSFRTRTAYPALVMNTRHDPITPARNASTMARLLPGSRVLITDGWGHTTLSNSGPCDTRYRERYLLDRALPARGATCGPGVVPFTDP